MDLLAVQVTLKSLLQHHSSKVSILVICEKGLLNLNSSLPMTLTIIIIISYIIIRSVREGSLQAVSHSYQHLYSLKRTQDEDLSLFSPSLKFNTRDRNTYLCGARDTTVNTSPSSTRAQHCP